MLVLPGEKMRLYQFAGTGEASSLRVPRPAAVHIYIVEDRQQLDL